MNRRLIAAFSMGAWALFAWAGFAAAQDAEAPKIRGFLFHADWCAKCKVLEPTLAEAVASYEARGAFELVRLDLTDQRPEALVGQRLRALDYGAQDAFDRHAPATGLLVLTDASSGREIATLTSKATYAAIQAALDEALARAP